MRKKTGTALAIAAASASMVALAASPASAATWTVGPTPAAGAPGPINFSGASTGALTLTATPHTPPTTLSCASSTATGTAPATGSGLSGTHIAKVNSLSFNTCTGPLGLTFTVTSGGLPWWFNAASYSAGVSTGALTGIHAHLSGPLCSADVDGSSATANNGSVNGTYTNSTQILAINGTGTLKVYNVSGCLGLLKNGDAAAFKGNYKIAVTTSPVVPAGGKLTITSP